MKKKWSTNKHERILQKKEFYKDNFAPMTIGELIKDPNKSLHLKLADLSDAFVLKIEVLFPHGGTCTHSWTERDADKTREAQGRKQKENP